MAISAGDAACTTGLSARIYNQRVADIAAGNSEGFSYPPTAGQTAIIKAESHNLAQALVDEVNASQWDGTTQVTSGGGVGGGWQVGYQVDFTSLATQNLITGGDGAKTIDGKTWDARGTAGATTFGITAGTGLVIQANANQPSLTAKFKDLAATLSGYVHDEIEVWARIINANTPATAGSWAILSVGDATTPAVPFTSHTMCTNEGFLTGRRNNAGTDTWLSGGQYGGTLVGGVAGTPQTTNLLTDDVVVIRAHNYMNATCFSGAYSAGWPAATALTPRGTLALYVAPQNVVRDVSPGNLGLAFCPQNGTTKLTITHLKVLYK
jgi:hypothetical protein